MRQRVAGFTLLELLVAMGIFAIIGAMALGGLNAIVGQESQARVQTDRLAALQRAVRLMTNDLAAALPRYVRQELGDAHELPLLSGIGPEFLVRVSRGGWTNPGFIRERGTLQRVQYRLEDGKLIREYWPVMDHVLGQEPRREELLTGVEEVKFEFFDDETGEWQKQWPPLSKIAAPDGQRPLAIQFTLELEDWGTIERLVELTP